MRLWSFLLLLLVTAAAVAGVVYLRQPQPEARVAERTGEAAFPALAAAPDRAVEIEIASKDGRFTLVRDAAGLWRAPARDGYPAELGKVRALLVGLTKLTLQERKTDRAERLSRLWLEDLEQPDARSTRVTVKAADGSLLADAYIGRNRQDPFGEGEGGTYLRLAGETQAWLAAGRVAPPTSLTDVFDRALVALPAEAIRKIAETRPDGALLLLERPARDGELTVKSGLPAEKTADPAALRRLAASLSSLAFEDVASADTLAGARRLGEASFTSFDGLAIHFAFVGKGEARWALVSASLAEERTEDPERLRELEDTIATLNAKTEGWAFRLSEAAFVRLLPDPVTLVPEAE